MLEILKYLFAHINFSGKIATFEDRRKLHAHVSDLFSAETSFEKKLDPNVHKSHYGFPECDGLYGLWVKDKMPDRDSYEVFGFNRNIQRNQAHKISVELSEGIKLLNQEVFKKLGFAGLSIDLEKQTQRTRIKRGAHQITGLALARNGSTRSGMRGPDAFLGYTIQLQRLLNESSLDHHLKEDQDRYDERVDAKLLPKLDRSDKKVEQTAYEIKECLKGMLVSEQ